MVDKKKKPLTFSDFEEAMKKRMDTGLDIQKGPDKPPFEGDGKRKKPKTRPTLSTDMTYEMDKLREKGFNPEKNRGPVTQGTNKGKTPTKKPYKPQVIKSFGGAETPTAFDDFESGMEKRLKSGLNIGTSPKPYIPPKSGWKVPPPKLNPTTVTDSNYEMSKLRDKGFNPKGSGNSSPVSSTALPPVDPNWKQQQKPKIFKAPPIPKAGSTLPQPSTPTKWTPPPIPGTAPKAGSPIPKAGDVLPQNPVRSRPMGAALPPTAWSPGASMDSSYDPARGQPTYIKDAEEARFADRAAQNFEKRDWYDTLSEEQKADHLARFRTNNAR